MRKRRNHDAGFKARVSAGRLRIPALHKKILVNMGRRNTDGPLRVATRREPMFPGILTMRAVQWSERFSSLLSSFPCRV